MRMDRYAVLELRSYEEMGGGPMVEALFDTEQEALDWIRRNSDQATHPHAASILYVVVKTIAHQDA
jgi:hypothetical protein